MKKILFTTLIIITLFLPLFTFAALKLEYKYPELPQTQTITTTSTLPTVIKYFATWAIIIASLVVAISLIVAGLQYLTSTGRPEAMTAAKNRIFNSFLGLLILLCSYLILITVNPKLVILSLEKAPVPGVLLLTEEGLKNFTGGSSVDELLSLNQARYLNYGIDDCEKEFGQLAGESENVTSVNFEKFPLQTIAFWKETDGKVKVINFAEKEFEPGNVELVELDYDISPEIPAFGTEIHATEMPFFLTEVSFKNLNTVGPKEVSKEVSHPPLSIELTGIGPGIYLYGEKAKQAYLGSVSIPHLKVKDFNDETREIKIDNKVDEYDYIAILHEDDHYAGQLRIFFEHKTERKAGEGQPAPVIEAGNVIPGQRVKVRDGDLAVIDRYGKVKKPTSAWIGELAKEPSVCKEVRICTGPHAQEYCISYALDSEKVDYEESVWLWKDTNNIQFYIPQNIPKEETVTRLKKDSPDTEDNPDKVKFADNIRSIKIDGDCLVVLFEHPIKDPDPGECKNCDQKNPLSTPAACKECWDHETPGGKSEIFGVDLGEGKGTEQDYSDLIDNEIHHCGWVKNLGFGKGESCASAIAIYPIKK